IKRKNIKKKKSNWRSEDMATHSKLLEEKRLLQSNKYNISISFVNSGLVVSDIPTTNSPNIKQRKVVIEETSNYFDSRFPARILTVNLNIKEINQIYASRQKIDKNGLLDIELLVLPTEGGEGVSHLNPFLDGKFKATMRNNESINNYLTASNGTEVTEQNIDMSTDVTFFLYREEELSFSLNSNINFNYTSASLMSMLVHVAAKAIPGTKMILSKFDHNPVVNNFLVPRMDFKDAIELLNDEFGFYKTDYMTFLQDKVLYFLNKDNEANVTNKNLDYEIILDVARYTGMDNSSSYKQDITSERVMRAKINVDKIKISVNNNGVMKNEPIYILPNGTSSFTSNTSARNVDVVRKITNIPHIQTLNNVQYEYIDVEFDDVSFINVNPLTKIIYIDSVDNIRKYRVCFKYVSVSSNETTITKLRAFRLLPQSKTTS
ncbi:MAG: hypothetical protein ACRCX8_16805, partial [Sarcina sp.]